jgi:hypothetical protein
MTEKKKNGRKLIPTDPDLDDAEKAAIKAVKQFETAEKTLDMFVLENPEIFKTYEQLIEERNQKLQVADAAVRATGGSFGPWQCYTEQKKYKPDVLYQHLGEKKFLEIGGVINQETVYTIDPQKIEVAIAAHIIREAAIDDIKKVTPVYRAPKPK